MTARVQHLRLFNTNQNPPPFRAQGELWVNYADLRLGFIDPAKNPQELLAVRRHATTASYATDDVMVRGGQLYRARAAISPHAFVATEWSFAFDALGLGNVMPPVDAASGTLWFPLADSVPSLPDNGRLVFNAYRTSGATYKNRATSGSVLIQGVNGQFQVLTAPSAPINTAPVFTASLTLAVDGTVSVPGGYLLGANHAIYMNTTKGNVALASPFDVNTGSSNLRNTFAGVNAGAGISDKSNNTGFGYGVLSTPGIANQETAFGTGALQNDSGGLFNNAFGSNAGLQLTTGNANVMVGHGTMGGDDFAPVPMTGSQNTVVGNWAGQEFVTSTGNSALGEYAMTNITDGLNNVAIGVGALAGKGSLSPPSTTPNTASNNVAIGVFALRNTRSDLQVAIGWNAMFLDETGVEGTAVGVKALALSVNDFRNTAMGYWALAGLNGGGANTAIGAEALISATTPNGVTALGAQAGHALTTGSNNTLIGFGVAPTLMTGVGNIIIGNSANADTVAANTNHTLFIGGVSGVAAIAGRNLDSPAPIVRFPGAMQLGGSPITVSLGQFGMPVTSLVGNLAPGVASVKLVAVAGTNPGTAKLVAFAGTSLVGVTVIDNIGAGV